MFASPSGPAVAEADVYVTFTSLPRLHCDDPRSDATAQIRVPGDTCLWEATVQAARVLQAANVLDPGTSQCIAEGGMDLFDFPTGHVRHPADAVDHGAAYIARVRPPAWTAQDERDARRTRRDEALAASSHVAAWAPASASLGAHSPMRTVTVGAASRRPEHVDPARYEDSTSATGSMPRRSLDLDLLRATYASPPPTSSSSSSHRRRDRFGASAADPASPFPAANTSGGGGLPSTAGRGMFAGGAHGPIEPIDDNSGAAAFDASSPFPMTMASPPPAPATSALRQHRHHQQQQQPSGTPSSPNSVLGSGGGGGARERIAVNGSPLPARHRFSATAHLEEWTPSATRRRRAAPSSARRRRSTSRGGGGHGRCSGVGCSRSPSPDGTKTSAGGPRRLTASRRQACDTFTPRWGAPQRCGDCGFTEQQHYVDQLADAAAAARALHVQRRSERLGGPPISAPSPSS